MSVPVYCPQCGSLLATKFEGGRDRVACLTDGCGYFYFGEASIGCGGVVVQGDRVLLIQRGIQPGRGTWQIPGGYVEADEVIHAAVEREVLEEAGIVARVTDSLGWRHTASAPSNTPDRPDRPANIYVVFRLDHVSGDPIHDGDETLNAGFFSLAEMARMEGVQALSLWAIRLALAHPPNAGLVSNHDHFDMRPGWSLFGLNRD